MSQPLSPDEWDEMYALKKAINENPYTVHPLKMERFTELFIRTLPKTDSTTLESNLQ